MFTGGLTISEQSMIHNWISEVVSGAKNARSKWLQQAPVAHAITMIIVYHNQDLFLGDKGFLQELTVAQHNHLLLQKAWEL
jgi:hypothetical protein